MENPIHVAITRKVKPGREVEFENAIRKFFAESLQGPGSLGVHLIKPPPGSTNSTYGILRSFGSIGDRDDFYRSDRFREWEEAVKPLVDDDYSRKNLHGLEAFFFNPGLIDHPPRWKMALVTWLGVWPTVYAAASLVGPHVSVLPPWLATGAVTFLVVPTLTWGVMPILTRLLRPWLIRAPENSRVERSGP